MIQFIFMMIAVSCDAFVFMLERGATLRNLKFKEVALHSLIFAATGVVMLSIGDGLGSLFHLSKQLITIHQYVSVFVTLAIGVVLGTITFRRKFFEERFNPDYNYKESFKRALLTSIDILLMGVSISVYKIPFTNIFLISFIMTFLFVLLALYIGYYKGAAFQKLIGYLCAITYFIIAYIQVYLFFLM